MKEISSHHLRSVQSHSCVRLFAIPWAAAHQASLSITKSQNPPKLMSIESAMPSNHLILCRPLLLLPSIFPSIRVFSNESVLRIRWPKYWSFSFNIRPFSEHPGLISFRMDRLDLLAVQGTLKRLLQHHSSKAYHPIMCKYGVHPMSKAVEEVNIPKCVFQFLSLANSAESKRFGMKPMWHSPQWSVSQDTGRQRRPEVGLRGRGGVNNKSITSLDVNQKIRFCLFPLGSFVNCHFLCPQGKEVSKHIMLGESGADVLSISKWHILDCDDSW